MATKLLRVILLLSLSQAAHANTWLVGPGRTYTKPSQVSNLVQGGDTILIDAGVYANDVARWSAHNLLFRGIGGLAHLKCGGTVYGGKAIWVIAGNDVTVENIEFSEAACVDQNGAGIRSEGINLTLRGCYFHDNEDGILAGDIASGDFLIEHCEFSRNGYATGQAHNLYINHAHSLTFRYNYSHDAKTGHEFKSRAYNNYIYCNRFSDENGTSSRSIDLPNGGFSIIVGNIIVQDPLSENNNMVGYGLEGLSNPNSELYVVYNTFVNNKSGGSFIQTANGTPKLKVYNNIFAGPGTVISGSAALLDTLSNRASTVAAFEFADPAAYDFHIAAGSLAVGIAADAGTAGAYSLNPAESYVHPAGFSTRANTHDAGAFAVAVPSGLTGIAQPPFLIYPNPVRDILYVEGAGTVLELQVMDLSGRIQAVQYFHNYLNINDLPKGLFFLKVLSNSGTRILPFVKQ